MSKKHKKLKKKKSIMQISPQIMEVNNVVADTSRNDTSPIQSAAEPAAPTASEPVREEFKYVRGDVKKILILMTIIIILLIGLYYLDIKTSYLADLGNWFYKILNIQAQ